MKVTFIAGAAALLAATAVSAQDKVVYPSVGFVTTEDGVRRYVENVGSQGGSMARVPLESKIVKGAPYSAEMITESSQTLPDGNRIVRRATGRVYRDSQGRTRREDDIEPGRVAGISIIDPVGQFAYSLDPQAKTAWKTPMGTARVLIDKIQERSADPAEIERRQKVESEMSAVAPTMMKQRAPGWDEKVEPLPSRNIEGVMADGKRVTRTIPAGAIGNEQPIVSVTEEWRSADLQVLVMTRTSDPRTGESTYRLQNIIRGEPNASWFEVPADYTVKESGVRRLQPSIK